MQAFAVDFECGFVRRIAHADIGTALIQHGQLICARRGGLIRENRLGGVVIHGLLAEKFVFLFFAGRVLRVAERGLRLGGDGYLVAVEIIAVGDFEFDGYALLVGLHLRHKRLFGRQQLRGIDGEGAAQAEEGGKEENQFFHCTDSVVDWLQRAGYRHFPPYCQTVCRQILSKLSKGRIMRSNAGGESSESRIRRQNCNRPSEKPLRHFSDGLFRPHRAWRWRPNKKAARRAALRVNNRL